MIKFEYGNIFDFNLQANAICHCISFDCKMGAGIAKTISERHPFMRNELLQCIHENHLNWPNCILYYDENNNENVFNLITKEKYWHKPTYDTVKKSLFYLRYCAAKRNMTHLIMPTIASGLDRLKWDKVLEIIHHVFDDTDIEVTIVLRR